jgi:uncharacterized membrane protein YsdA (DUF1294 family)
MNDMLFLIIMIYIICNIPAFILLGVGLHKRSKKDDRGTGYLIAAAVYFLIGGGICGSLLGGI